MSLNDNVSCQITNYSVYMNEPKYLTCNFCFLKYGILKNIFF